MLVEAAVPHIETLLNRKLRDSITAREFCKTLSGKVLEIKIDAIPDRILLAPIGETIEVLTDKDLKANVIFSGSVMHFMQATQTKPMELVRAGKLKMKGDAVLAGQFQRLIELVMPDWQEEVSKLFGDYAGPQISNALQGFMSFGQQVLKSFTEKPSSQKADGFYDGFGESDKAPSLDEFSEFSSDVQDLQKELNELENSL